MKLLRFERSWSLYNPGETAGFDAATASALVQSGVAVEVAEPLPAAPAAPAASARRRASRPDKAD